MRKNVRHISYNGELIPETNFKLDVGNRGFLYGDGIFETMRTKGVTVPFFDFHMDRLFRGMDMLKMTPDFTRVQVQQWLEALIQRDLLFNPLRVRITITRKAGGLYTPQTNNVDVLIQATPLETKGFTFNKKGLLVDVFKDHPKPMSKLWNFKIGSALPYVLAGVFKAENKLDDCLLINEKGGIVEGLSSNLFLIKKGTIFTPSLATGCVDGVMRRVILEIAEEQSMIVAEAESISEEFILDADEMFLTNAVQGIQWVMGCKGKRYHYSGSKRLSDLLIKRAGI